MIAQTLILGAVEAGAASDGAGGGASLQGVANLVAAVALAGGLFFLFVGALGVFRLPDVYHRLHAATKCTTLGLTGMLLAVCLVMAEPIVVSKAVITIIFTFVANPIGSHLIAKAAHHGHAPQWKDTLSDELGEDKEDPRMSASDDFIGVPGLDGEVRGDSESAGGKPGPGVA